MLEHYLGDGINILEHYLLERYPLLYEEDIHDLFENTPLGI